MPAYNFQGKFASKILDRSKFHTIRHKRKRPTRAGDRLMLFTGMRTKSCKLVARTRCVKVEPINIYPGQRVLLNEVWLNHIEIVALANADGFENIAKFFEFFEEHYALPTSDFEIVHWDVGDAFMPRGRR